LYEESGFHGIENVGLVDDVDVLSLRVGNLFKPRVAGSCSTE
jgi:hypothetical protein